MRVETPEDRGNRRRLEEEFDYELSLWSIFEDLTVEKLDALMEEA